MLSYDAVIVGAGNAGISAACKMAKSGKKTLLIERHNIPGGCATSFRRGRFEFETSLHELCDYGPDENPGEIRKLLNDEYGLDIKWCEVPDNFRVISTTRTGRKIDVVMPSGRKAFTDKMEYYVPGSRKGMEDYFALADETDAALTYINQSNGKADSQYMKEHFPNFLRTAACSTDKVLKALKLPSDAIDILNTYWGYLGVPTDQLSFVHYTAMVNKYISRSAYIPQLTSHGLSLALVDRFQKMGGEIWYNCEVKKVLFDGDRVSGVSTTQGDIAAKHVILNCSPHIAYATMIPKELVPESEIRLANARTHSARAFVLYLGLDKTAEQLGIKDYSIFLPDSMDPRAMYRQLATIKDNNYSIALCYNTVNPEISPAGTCLMSFTTIFTEEDWADIPVQEYVKTKNLIAKRMIDNFEKKTGIIIRDSIEEMAVASPWTFARYINSPQGTIYGYETNDWDSMMARMMSLKTMYPIKGLKFAGTSGPRGDGYSSTYVCGNLVARLTLKDMAEEEGK